MKTKPYRPAHRIARPSLSLAALTALLAAVPLTPAPAAPAAPGGTARALAAAPKVVLASGKLKVTIAPPDGKKGFYRSTRFDWSGMITDVTLGATHFYGPWTDGVSEEVHDFADTPTGVVVSPRNPATGPAEEFANRDGETVPGYNAAPAGGTFIKIGVGRLRKADLKPYDHFNAYDIVDGGTWTLRRTPARMVFIQRLPTGADGYGYEYEKSVTLAPGGVMTIAHRLRNTGRLPIQTQLYTHNFARFGGAEIGPGVTARFPFPLTGPVSDPALAAIDGNELRYLKPLHPGDRIQLPAQPGDPALNGGPFTITGANGASITMAADVPLVRTAIWSIRRTVAIEPFVAINVASGAEQRWSWRYTYTEAKRPR
ncbi:hypothetical protein H7F51_18345 [Novosphingobium flavum]|uniref:Uncharacterized protein n=1 Tax=Novosphingobium flavum TaxID=1778672 RepID=A0A7X1KNJ0_9SPHN|nr:hypothetical protein [Novosphingobium flavum]MBC2667483.1 hypothetical protein [Novosphingobium flavum]